MQDNELSAVLLRLESAGPQIEPAAKRSKAAMLAAFDSLDAAEDAGESQPGGSAAEITLLPRPKPTAVRKRSAWMLVPAAAAVLILVLVAGKIGNSDRFDPSFVVAADTVTGESANPAPGDEEPGSAGVPIVDNDLPRLIRERFTTTALSVEMSFVADRPIWLTHHQPGVVGLSLDPLDALAAEMFVARLADPNGKPNSDSVIEFLQNESSVVDGQVKPITVAGIDGLYWRGRVDADAAESADCAAGELCLVLVDEPVQIGIRTDFTNDVVELPLPNGDTLILVASIPLADFDLEPFATAFDDVVATISFSQDTVGQGD